MLLYFDNSATTPINPEAQKIIDIYSAEKFFNPSSLNIFSMQVAQDIEKARKVVSSLLGCNQGEIVFTSGGTEADNLAIFGSVKQQNGANVVTNLGEHAAVAKCFDLLEQKGMSVRRGGLLGNGQVDTEQLLSLVDQNTKLVSVMHVNNETGAINDIDGISRKVKQINPNTLFMSDGIQAVGKIEVFLSALPCVDLYTASSHKVNGPKGVGVLFVRKGLHINPMFFGGGQEKDARSGTENVSGIMAFAKALEIACNNRVSNEENYFLFKKIILQKLAPIGNFIQVCDTNCCHGILTLAFCDIKAQVLSNLLEQNNVVVGLGSACNARHGVSKVMVATGIDKRYIEGVVRISFGSTNTTEQVEAFSEILSQSVVNLRAMLGLK